MAIKLCVCSAFALVACGGSNNSGAPTDAPPDMALDPPPTVTIRLDPPGGAPLVAFQDGDGAWQTVPGSNGVYTARVENNRYAVAVACPGTASINESPFIWESYRTLDAGPTLDVVGCVTAPAPDYFNVTVNLAGVTGTDRPDAWIGNASGAGTGNASIVVPVARGKADVFVSDGDFETPIFYRGPTLDVQGEQTIAVDLSTAGHHLESHAITVSGFVAGDQAQIFSNYATPYSYGLWRLVSVNAGSVNNYQTIDARDRHPGDVTDVEARTYHHVDNETVAERYIHTAVTDPVDLSLALPGTWPVPEPTVLDAATSQARITLPVTPSTLGIVDYTATFRTSTFSDTPGTLLEIHATSGWLGSALGSSPTITTPDLSHLPGWLPEMGLSSGSPLDFFVYRNERNMPQGAPAVDGRRVIGNVLYGAAVRLDGRSD